MIGGQLADRVHPGVEVERRQARAGVADLGNAQRRPAFLTLGERIGGHCRRLLIERKVAQTALTAALQLLRRLTKFGALRHWTPRLEAARGRFSFFSIWDLPMAKPATVKIKLVSTADTGFFYVTKKNPRTQTEKLSFKKYDPNVRKHVEFKEAKIK